MKAIIAFLAGLLLGYLLCRTRVLSYPVAGTVEHQPGDMWPPNVTWSYAPPNPGTWN